MKQPRVSMGALDAPLSIEDKIIFSANNPVIASHKVFGKYVLPGFAYIDLVFQFLQKHGHSFRQLRLKNLTIHNALVVPEQGKVQTSLTMTKNGQRMKVQLKESAVGVDATPTLYITVDATANEKPLAETMSEDFEKLKRSSIQTRMHDVYRQYAEIGLMHEPFMKAEGMIYRSATGLLFDAELTPSAQAGEHGFLFHPSLLDASAVAALPLFETLTQEGNLFLPLHYESVAFAEPIQKNCLAYIPISSINRKNETVSLSIYYYNSHGCKIGEVLNFTTKMVRPQIASEQIDTPLLHEYSDQRTVDKEKTTIIGYLRKIIAEALGQQNDSIDIFTGYYDMGLDSARLLGLVDVLSAKIDTDLSPTLLFEYPNLNGLADYLVKNYSAQFESKLFTHNGASINLADAGHVNNGHIKNEYPYVNGHHKSNDQGLEEIAIIGMAGQYPKAQNLDEFWDNLIKGKDCISSIPEGRWETSRFDSVKSPSGKKISQRGGFIDNPGFFDPLFFKISAREAEVMDPQERLFLEVCWNAIEDAGHTPASLTGDKKKENKVGVFAGVMHKDYALIGNEVYKTGKFIPLSINNSAIANRVSYCCNFKGPSLVVDTACSSSLVAVHLALQSIWTGECDVALAGGVNLSLHPAKYVSYGLIDMHSSEGLCRTFGKGGDGYVSAEGVGAVILKPLKKAVEDGDHVYAVIKASAINHVGAVSGLTVPSPVSQEALIKDCLNKAAIDSRSISYIEAHGTGTSLGDPIEIQGLVKAFASTAKNYCAIGSVKSNIGHAEAAAGISGLTKLALQLKYRMLVPSLHADEANPYIDLKNSPFYIQQKAAAWHRPEVDDGISRRSYPRRGGISSFGATGTNVHLILEEYQGDNLQADQDERQHLYLMPLSARNKQELNAVLTSLLKYLINHNSGAPEHMLNMSYTLQLGRVEMNERVIFLTKSASMLTEQLREFIYNGLADGVFYESLVHNNIESGGLLSLSTADIHNAIENGGTLNLLTRTAKSWVKGKIINWEVFYINNKLYGKPPRRMSLPTYPFKRQFYWMPGLVKSDIGGNEFTSGGISQTPIESQIDQAHSVGKNFDDETDILKKLIHKLKVLFAGIVKFSVDTIDETAQLEHYGIDSIMIVELNKSLEEVYGKLSKTLFYEYLTLTELARYLAIEHRRSSLHWLQMFEPDTIKADTVKRQQSHSTTVDTSVLSYDHNKYKQEPVAIIGISGRYAGADNLKEFWEHLKAGKDAITEIPADRWPMENFFHEDSVEAGAFGKSYGKWGSFIKGFADFDPMFFNISPKEARGMDPHIRLFIESCWAVMEDAGYTRKKINEHYNGEVGVFAGVTRTGYSYYVPELMKNGLYPLNTMSAVANRVSYIFNFKGPSVPVDTMCSSSLTAIHDACESLALGRCKMAIAGGVNLLLHPHEYIMLSANNFLSTDGRCRSFGVGGDGYVPGEGVGVVLLKTLQQAIKDKDHIYAVIKSTSINHGGKTNGYTVPNPVAQRELIRSAIDRAGISAKDISYVEAHGTGTSLGDPIEITGLTQAFGGASDHTQYCALGSLKSNIGHLEAAAGIAALTKVVLQMQHGMLVPSLHANELNPNINFQSSPFYVQKTLSEWKRKKVVNDSKEQIVPRIAGISSFGAGGSNAHIIIEEYLPGETSGASHIALDEPPCYAFVLSAKNKDRLKVYAANLLSELDEGKIDNTRLEQLAYTLQTGREPMEARLAFQVSTVSEAVSSLRSFIESDILTPGIYTGDIRQPGKAAPISAAELKLPSGTQARGDVNHLLQAWVQGAEINWEKLYKSSAKPMKISLPTYPFDRKRYWVTDASIKPSHDTAARQTDYSMLQNQSAISGTSDKALKNEESKIMRFQEVLEEKDIDTGHDTKRQVKHIVCFSSDASNQQLIGSVFSEVDDACKVVFIDNDKRKDQRRENCYTINSIHDPDNYKSVFLETMKLLGSIDAIIYLWPLEDKSFNSNYDTIVAILQGIGLAKMKPERLILAANWSQQQNGVPSLEDCYLESWIGFERSLKLIMPDVNVKTVFCESVNSTAEPDTRWVRKICLEIRNSESAYYRNERRFVYKIRPLSLDTCEDPLKKGGTYFITGGLGGLGFIFARYLAVNYNANLILSGRSFPDQIKLDTLKKLQQGSRLIYLKADICNADEMSLKLQEVKAEVGAIHGVIHAAGIIGKQILFEKDSGSFKKILDPKINGTIVLDELLKDEPLDFVCYFSSSSAILGDFGSCDYAVANRFQIAFSNYRNALVKLGSRTGKTFAVSWPLWKEGGMNLNEDASTKMYLQSTGQRYLESAEGVDVFREIIASDATHQLILTGDQTRINRFLKLQPSQITVNREHAPKQIKSATTKVLNGDEMLEEELMQIVSSAQQIPLENLFVDANLADLGFDSISLTALARTLTQHFGVEIVPAIFFGHSTIGKLKDYFLKEHTQLIHARYKVKVSNDQATSITHVSGKDAVFKSSEEILQNLQATGSTQLFTEPVAIIGMSGKFPQARNVDEMWRILAEGRDTVQEIPIERFDLREYFSKETQEGKTNCKWSGLIPGVEEFDANFFEIMPHDAELMDPRQRLLLQEAWNALEDAGYGPLQLKEKKIGFYVGVEEGSYDVLTRQFGVTPNHNALLAARLSYFLNLSGPNMAINTACSSGLVAAHQAFQSLQTGDCDTALAAGVNIMLSPEMYVGMTSAGMLSPDGKCYTFDKRANGLVPGEAVVVIVMKRLSKAIEDRDPIYGIVRGSGLNYDGKTNGITAPNGVSQAALFTSVYSKFKIDPAEIDYVVTHGTGTRLGDPVEINALSESFKAFTQKKNYCAITSTKTNFGHTFAASGLVSLVSLIQSFVNDAIPAHLNCDVESDYINWSESPFYINKAKRSWVPQPGKERLGAVSAFGVSGTNAHMVVQSYTDTQELHAEVAPYYLLLISAKTAVALQTKIGDLLHMLDNGSATSKRMTDISYTLSAGRHHFKYRAAFIVEDTMDAIRVLKKFSEKIRSSVIFQGEVSRNFRPLSSVEKFIAALTASLKEKNDHAVYREDLAALADLYCQGYQFSLEDLFKDADPRRIHLPAYPFARDHYWASHKKEAHVALSPASEVATPGPFNVDLSLNEKSFVKERTLVFKPHWMISPVPEVAQQFKISNHFVIINEQLKITSHHLQHFLPEAKIVEIPAAKGSIGERFSTYSEAIFQQVMQIVRVHLQEDILIQVIIDDNGDSSCFIGIAGFLRTVSLEHPNVKCQVITSDFSLPGTSEVGKMLRENITDWNHNHIKYIDGKRYVCDWSPTRDENRVSNKLWRDNGTYLITGGAGHLGLFFARAIAERTKGVNIILTGRSVLNAKAKEVINDISSPNCNVTYKQVDIACKEEVDDLLISILKSNGQLHGILHCAGVIHDSLVLNKTAEEWKAVLSPKVIGVENLDEASKDITLDFFVTFSSLAGVMGNPGQGDYAAANAFLDVFSAHRRLLVLAKKRHGHSMSINWPLWEEGGMTVDDVVQGRLEAFGMKPLPASEGLKAFYDVMSLKDDCQAMVVFGEDEKIFQKLLGKGEGKTSTIISSKRTIEMTGFTTRQCLEIDLTTLASQISKIPRERFDVQENLTDLGFDSISLTKLSASLSKHFQLEITPALFFGYPTLEKLTTYFMEQHQQYMDVFYNEVPAHGEHDTNQKAYDAKIYSQDSVSLKQRTVTFEDQRGKFLSQEPIAIIGMSGRFPNARNVDELWDILENGSDVVSEIPADRFDFNRHYSHTVSRGKTNCKWSGLVPGIKEFDPLFFEISPKEAALMDPRQRLLLQEAWRALEDAGYGANHITQSKIAMFVGAEESVYGTLTGDEGNITSNSSSILAARLSYFLNLTGPNMTINTACSSALVAIHQACMSLRNFESDTALAAGVNLLYTPEPYVAMAQAGMLSPSGKSFVFDKRADGIVPGESVAVVVLKRLSQAIEDRDPIYATILGSGVNYDGKTNGITAPSGVSQTALLNSVYDRIGINPEQIEYVVTHGTGTILGDPVEINALNDAFRQHTKRTSFCALTSNKTNLGHTMAASGLVSLISLVQSFRYQTIPASLHCEQENDYINWKDSPFFVNKKNKPWPARDTERTGAVSSFGMSGTNVHVVLQSYQDKRPREQYNDNALHMLVLSAKTPVSLDDKIKELISLMKNKKLRDVTMGDVEYTLLSGRHHFRYRCAVIIRTSEDAIYALERFQKNDKRPNVFRGDVPHDFRGQSMIKDYIVSLAKQKQYLLNEIQKCQELLCTMAAFYCQGYDMPADILNEGVNAIRIHLPAYPFSRENYWVNENMAAHTFDNNLKKNAPPVEVNGVANSSTNEITSVHRTSHNDKARKISDKENPAETGIMQYLIAQIALITNVTHDKIDVDVTLDRYGIDSIVMAQLRKTLEETLGELPPALFFDYPSVRALTQYFTTEHINSVEHIFAGHSGQEIVLQAEFDISAKEHESKITSILTDDTITVGMGDTSERQAIIGRQITELIAAVMNLQQDKIDPHLPLRNYGLDSILMVQMKSQFESTFGPLPDNLFYEYETTHDLAHFIFQLSPTVSAQWNE